MRKYRLKCWDKYNDVAVPQSAFAAMVVGRAREGKMAYMRVLNRLESGLSGGTYMPTRNPMRFWYYIAIILVLHCLGSSLGELGYCTPVKEKREGEVIAPNKG